MARPRIGHHHLPRLSAALGAVWDEPADLLPTNYSDVVRSRRRGCLAYPADGRRCGEARRPFPRRVGTDWFLQAAPMVDPGQYGARRDPHTGPARPGSRHELRHCWLALRSLGSCRYLPSAGECRCLTSSLGGSLIQHLAGTWWTTRGTVQRPACTDGIEVNVAGESKARRTARAQTVGVATYHHQAVADLGRGLTATAWGRGRGQSKASSSPDAGLGGWGAVAPGGPRRRRVCSPDSSRSVPSSGPVEHRALS